MKMSEKNSHRLFDGPGTFVLGCNYWASHAGVRMWSDWQPSVVEQDLEHLRRLGLQVLRVFPLWPDFQPINALYRPGPVVKEIRHGEESLSNDALGVAGMSAEAIQHFEEFVRIAERHGFSLIVSLITGWMSGRLFVPFALEGKNVLTDPMAIRWQLRFIKCFVARFRECQTISGWGLGNECNVMGGATQDEAYTWTATISNAIRAADPNRPILSDMHGLLADAGAPWRIQDQGELTDVLTTHPYPLFTPHCARDPLNTIRSCLHSVAESRLYADVGNAPCVPAEFGTLGPMVSSDKIAGDYTRACLFANWAHDNRGLLWWCGYDKAHLPNAPYDWDALECELGLLCSDYTPKPAAESLKAFSEFLKSLPFASLPPVKRDAVCILSHGQDTWASAYSSFILATQAGLALEFQFVDQPLRDSSVYLLPNAAESHCIPKHKWLALLDKVRDGATLYVSSHSVILSGFEEATGLRLITRRQGGLETIRFSGITGLDEIQANVPVRFHLESVGAHVFGHFADGSVACARHEYGKGEVFFLAAPLEQYLAETPGLFPFPEKYPAWRIYEHIGRASLAAHIASKDHPLISLTEHAVDENCCVLVLINLSPVRITTKLALQLGWSVEKALYGVQPKNDIYSLPANDAVVLVIRR